MATINGVSFEFEELSIVSEQRNVVSPQPGADTNFITGMGYKGLVLRLSGHESTLALYDAVISEFMKEGEQTLVHRTGWQFKVYSATLMPVLLAGIPENYYPYELILLTATPYRESTTETTRTKTITTNNQEWSADNSSNDIDTDGSVDAVPDIQITGGNGEGKTWSGSQTSASLGNGTITKAGIKQTLSAPINIISFSAWVSRAVGAPTGTLYCKIYDTSDNLIATSDTTIDVTTISNVIFEKQEFWFNSGPDIPSTHRIVLEFTGDASNYLGYLYYSTNNDTDVERTVYTGTWTDNSNDWYGDLHYSVKIIGPEIYNIADTTVKCAIANTMLCEAIHRINTDGTGTVDYNEDFSTRKWRLDTTNLNITHNESTVYGSDLSGTGALTAYTDPSGTLGQLVDNNTATVYDTGSPAAGQWMKWDFGAATPKRLRKFRLMNQSSFGINSFILAGSNDDSTWTAVCTDSAANNTSWQDFTFSNIVDYRYYRLYVVSGHIPVSFVYIKEVELLEITEPSLDIADDGYLYYHVDVKGIVSSIPSLTTRVNITSGTPTIQISEDASTWYDIITAIVDDVNTAYNLDSSSLSLKGLTDFYFRIDCVKAAAATCSIKSLDLDVSMVTIDFEHPKISESGVSTFRCDQDSDSGLNCDISLIFSDRSWAI